MFPRYIDCFPCLSVCPSACISLSFLSTFSPNVNPREVLSFAEINASAPVLMRILKSSSFFSRRVPSALFQKTPIHQTPATWANPIHQIHTTSTGFRGYATLQAQQVVPGELRITRDLMHEVYDFTHLRSQHGFVRVVRVTQAAIRNRSKTKQ